MTTKSLSIFYEIDITTIRVTILIFREVVKVNFDDLQAFFTMSLGIGSISIAIYAIINRKFLKKWREWINGKEA
jgi:hypothetical protein